MRAAQTPAGAGQRLSPEPAQASVIPVRTFPGSASGQPAAAARSATDGRDDARREAPAVPQQRSAMEHQPAQPVAPRRRPRQLQTSAADAVREAPTGVLEFALMGLGGAFALLVPAFFWRRARS